MTIEQAKKEMGYYSEEEYGKGSSVAESHKMAIRALEMQEKIETFINNAETNYDKELAIAIKRICEIL